MPPSDVGGVGAVAGCTVCGEVSVATAALLFGLGGYCVKVPLLFTAGVCPEVGGNADTVLSVAAADGCVVGIEFIPFGPVLALIALAPTFAVLAVVDGLATGLATFPDLLA